MDTIKVGIISFEHMHALSYTTELMKIEGVEVVGIADADETRGRRMAERFHTTYYREYEELLDTDIVGVVICTNNKLHSEVAIAAANKGKHILVEKPFAINIEAAKAMLEAAEANKVKIMTAFPMRFNPNVREAKAIVDRGEIGNILCITGINHGKIPSGWFIDPELSGGGGVMDHTVHLADLIRWFTNSEYKSVYCESGELIHHKGIDDCGIVNVELENGVFATIDCSWAHHKNYEIWPEVYMEIIGDKGVLEVSAFGQVKRVYDAEHNVIEDTVWNEDGDEGLIKEFVEVCRTEKEPFVTGFDGMKAAEVAMAAYLSTEEHRKVVI